MDNLKNIPPNTVQQLFVSIHKHTDSKYPYYYNFKLVQLQDTTNLEKLKHYAFTSAILQPATKHSLDAYIKLHPDKFPNQDSINAYYNRHIGKTYKDKRHTIGYTNLGIVDIDESSISAATLAEHFITNKTNILGIFPSYSQRHLPPEECTKMRVLYIRPYCYNSDIANNDNLAQFQLLNNMQSLPLWEHYKELYAKEMTILNLPDECAYDENFLKLSQHSKPVLDPKEKSWTIQPTDILPLYEVNAPEGGTRCS